MASLYTRADSPFYWLKFRDTDGRLKQVSTRCRWAIASEVRLAKEMEAAKTLAEIQQGRTRHSKQAWSWVPDFLKLHGVARYEDVWKSIALFITQHRIDSPAHLTRKHCFDYIEWRQIPEAAQGKYKACHNTALFELKVLRVVMQEAVERGLATGNPAVKLGIRTHKPKTKPEMSADDCELIRAKIEADANVFRREMLSNSFEIARYQGCRLAETRLNPQTDVDLEAGTIRFRIKGNREFTTMLHPKLVGLFERLKEAGRTSTWDAPANAPRQWAAIQWWKFLKRIGLKQRGITFHSTRVTVVTELARNNVHESKAKSYVGHASTTVHRIYQRLRPSDLSDCVDVVG